jgi:LAS superfamily LD-carboxypeptidase LdcB
MRLTILERVLLPLSILLLGAGAFGGYQFYELYTTSTADTASSTARIAKLESMLSDSEQINNDLAYSLHEANAANKTLTEEVERLTGKVDTLDKLANTDKELLQKYSKVYFLNENYVPEGLSELDPDWVLPKEKVLEVHRQVRGPLEELLEEAEDDGIDLRVISGYRSFGTQRELKADYSIRYGFGANAFSADQGYSEHQLGTAVDFSTLALNGSLSGFGDTEAYDWLLQNAHKFGFIISYPRNNGYYIYEPWHWRYVGEKLARHLKKEDKYFYDLDQREIDEYLISMFD